MKYKLNPQYRVVPSVEVLGLDAVLMVKPIADVFNLSFDADKVFITQDRIIFNDREIVCTVVNNTPTLINYKSAVAPIRHKYTDTPVEFTGNKLIQMFNHAVNLEAVLTHAIADRIRISLYWQQEIFEKIVFTPTQIEIQDIHITLTNRNNKLRYNRKTGLVSIYQNNEFIPVVVRWPVADNNIYRINSMIERLTPSTPTPVPQIIYTDDMKQKWQSVTASVNLELPFPFNSDMEAYGADESEAREELMKDIETFLNTVTTQCNKLLNK